jgi:hypothetical protein
MNGTAQLLPYAEALFVGILVSLLSGAHILESPIEESNPLGGRSPTKGEAANNRQITRAREEGRRRQSRPGLSKADLPSPYRRSRPLHAERQVLFPVELEVPHMLEVLLDMPGMRDLGWIDMTGGRC